MGRHHGISPCSQTTHFPHLILHQHKAFATLQLCLCKIAHSTTTTTCDWVHFCKYYLIILTPLIPHTAAEETKVQRSARNSRSKAPVQTLELLSLCLSNRPSFCFLIPFPQPPYHPHSSPCLFPIPAELTLSLSHTSLSRQVGVGGRRGGQLSGDYKPGFVFFVATKHGWRGGSRICGPFWTPSEPLGV